MAHRIHPATDETLQRVAFAIEALAGRLALEWDSENGWYTNESVKAWLDSMGGPESYGVSIPTGSAIACTKLGANAGIAAPVPGVIGRPAVDPYVGIPAFFHIDVNGVVDADGMPHLTGIEGDGRFRRDGSNGDVWVLAPVLYFLTGTATNAVTLFISKQKLSGMSAQPGAKLPDGSLRPYMLYAKYAGGMYGERYSSVSGVASRNRDVSHSTLRTICSTASSGYAGKSYADDWYVKAMFMLKYATKHSQAVMAGCTSYNLSYAVTVAESGVTRVIIAKTNAANLIVGSSVSLGSADHSNSVLGESVITRIEDYDTSNSAVYLDVSAAFTTTTSLKLSTGPWHTGSTDGVEGDGSPFSNTSGKEPFKFQGIELCVGFYEVLGDVIVNSDGSTGWEICLNKDSRNEATSLTADYTHTGKYLYSSSADGWSYPLYPDFTCDLPFGVSSGASQTTGMCDGTYTNKTATSGAREWLGLGDLYVGGNAGLWCVYAHNGLGSAYWAFGSRLSALGRKG